jgi:protein gp37
MNQTGIEWASMTWNVLRGCSWASPGCDHCYAEAIAQRFSKPGQPFENVVDKDTKTWNGTLEFMPHKLSEPRKKRAPQLIFANSMSDICHPEVKPEWIDAIFAEMIAARQHFYMMLTKRPNLIKRKFWGPRANGELRFFSETGWPGHLAMGTSIEHEKFLWRGYRLLEQWPGSCFLSLEPLISHLNIKSLLRADQEGRIKQIIVGGESGKDVRYMDPTWVMQLRDETKEAGRDFFFKQWGDQWTKKWLKVLGRKLDGREWNESPWPVPLTINQEVPAMPQLPLLGA